MVEADLRPTRFRPLPGAPARPLRTAAWRPAWLQGALTIGAAVGVVKYLGQVILRLGWLTEFWDEYAQKGDAQTRAVALQ